MRRHAGTRAAMSQPQLIFRREHRRSALLVPLLAALAIVAAATVLAVVAHHANERHRQAATEQRVEAAVTLIERRMVAYVDMLGAVRSFLEQTGTDDPYAYREFVQGLHVEDRYPGVQVVSVAVMTTADDLEDETTRRTSLLAPAGYPAFAVHPTPTTGDVAAVVLLEPVEGNEPALGFDLLSERERAATLARARDTGTFAATPAVRLVQETERQLGVLVMAPMYEGGDVPTTVEQRREGFLGVVMASFRMGDLMEGVLGSGAHTSGLAVYDVGATSTTWMYAVDATAQRHPSTLPSAETGTVEVGGRTWLVHVDPPPDTLSTLQQSRPLVIVLIGAVLAGLVGVVLHSTRSARRYAELLAAARSSELDALTAAASDAIVTVDADGRIVGWNAAAERTFGHSRADALGQALTMLLPDAGRDRYLDRFRQLREGNAGPELAPLLANGTIELDAVHRDGRIVPVELSFSAWRAHGTSFFTGIARDVSDRRAAEAAEAATLARERDVVATLRQLDTAKSEFVATVSHELRTPLTSIIGFAELLLDDLTDDEASRRQMVEAIERNGRRLRELVDDLLTMSRMEAGRFQIEHRPVDMADVVRAAAETVRPMVIQRDLAIAVTTADGAAPVLGDRVQLERVMLNLLSNAVKATGPGGTIIASVTRSHDAVVVSVADTGVGIPAAEIDTLFTPFTRTSTARQHAIQGTGLGLSIVRTIVEEHGGTVDVRSTEGEGTTFVVRLPAVEQRASTSSTGTITDRLQEVPT